MQFKRSVAFLALFAAGIACGAYLFGQSIPRPLLASSACGAHCYTSQEVAGLLASAAILRVPFLVPGVEMESDSCLAIRHPKPDAHTHYVLFPKHDTRNIATLTAADTPYVMGCFALVRALVERDHLRNYRVLTNGPGLQDVAILHFHLIAY